MGFRFRKSFKIAPGLRLNIGKKSSSLSFGRKGARYTISSKGRRTTTFGIPGTGLSYSTSSGGRKSAARNRTTSTSKSSSRRANAVSTEYSPYTSNDYEPKKTKTPIWKIVIAVYIIFWILVGAVTSCGNEEPEATPDETEQAVSNAQEEVTNELEEETETSGLGEPVGDVVFVPIEVTEDEPEELPSETTEPEIEENPSTEAPVETQPAVVETVVETPETTTPVVEPPPIVSDPIVSDPVVTPPVVDDPLSGGQTDTPTYVDPLYQEPTYQEPVVDMPVGTNYVKNINSYVFHYDWCESVGRMSEKNKQFYTGTRDEIIAQGFSACQNCNP